MGPCLERSGSLSLRRGGTRRRPSSSTPRRPPSRARSTWATSSAIPRRMCWRATSGCAGATCSIRWAGTTTACPPNAACRTTSTSAASPACPTSRDCRAAGRGRRRPQDAAAQGLAQELHRAVSRPHRRGREGLQGALAAARALGGLGPRVLDDQRPEPAHGAGQLPRPAPQGPRLQRRGSDDVGRGLPHRGGPGRGGGPAAEGRLPPHPLRGRGRAAGSSSPPPGPSCCRPASAWPPIPRTSGTRTSSAAARSLRSFARRCPSSRARWWTARREPAS